MVDLSARVELDALRKKHNDPKAVFFRSGLTGEYKQVINDPVILQDIVRIEPPSKFTNLSDVFYELRIIRKDPVQLKRHLSRIKRAIRERVSYKWRQI